MNFTEKKKSFLTGRATTELRKLDIESQRKVINYLLKKIDISTLSNEARSFVGKLSKNTFGQHDYNPSKQPPTPQSYSEPKVEPINRDLEESKEPVSTMPSLEDFDKMEAVEQKEIESMKKEWLSTIVILTLNDIDSHLPAFSYNIFNYLLWKKEPKGDPPALTKDELHFIESLIINMDGQYDFKTSVVTNPKTKDVIPEQKNLSSPVPATMDMAGPEKEHILTAEKDQGCEEKTKEKKEWKEVISLEVANELMKRPKDSRERIFAFVLWKEGIEEERPMLSEDELRFFNSLIKNANGQYDFPPKNDAIALSLSLELEEKIYEYKDSKGKTYSLIVIKQDLEDMAKQIAEYTKKEMLFDDAKGFVAIPYLSKKIGDANKDMTDYDARLFAADIMDDIFKRD
ncbi:hypothetical protein KAW38_01665 [Candidatus Micrarchaeota archaeon]|nr:hypothetical protein [Candidatus Micrarchaeota archaeon]